MKILMDSETQVPFLVTIAPFIQSFLIAAFLEECAKLTIGLLGQSLNQSNEAYFNIHAVMIYSLAGAVGLASFENFLYILLTAANSVGSGLVTVVLRTFLAVPLHCATGIIIGSELALNSFLLQAKPIWRIMLTPILIHGMYDFLLEISQKFILDEALVFLFFLGGALLVVAVAVFLAKKRRNLILEERSQFGILPQ